MERVSIKPLKDEYGIIKSAKEILPKELWNDFIESIAELEDNNSHITATYPKTRLHKVAGSKKINLQGRHQTNFRMAVAHSIQCR